MASHDTSPEPVYADEIETLREMLKEEYARVVSLRAESERRGGGTPTAAGLWAVQRSSRRIEALTTAIEALGGAL